MVVGILITAGVALFSVALLVGASKEMLICHCVSGEVRVHGHPRDPTSCTVVMLTIADTPPLYHLRKWAEFYNVVLVVTGRLFSYDGFNDYGMHSLNAARITLLGEITGLSCAVSCAQIIRVGFNCIGLREKCAVNPLEPIMTVKGLLAWVLRSKKRF